MKTEHTSSQKITPFLWFDNNAEGAAIFYTSVFKDSKIKSGKRFEGKGTAPSEKVMIVEFELNGQNFIALNGGPRFTFTEAVSFVIHCENQKEVDWYWGKLSEGGEEQNCGWLKDKFGLSWQIVPNVLMKLMSDKNQEKAGRVMQAMLQMKKIKIEELEKAYEQNQD